MKRIKFALQMKDGVQARTLEELRGAFDLELVMGYLADGKLERWLGDRFYEEEAERIVGLDRESPDLGKRICDILQVPYPEELEMSLEEIAARKERLKKLQGITDDEVILSRVDQVAFDQEELAERLEEGWRTIYLCGEGFRIPERVEGITYIGVGTTLKIDGDKLARYKEKGIELVDLVAMPEKEGESGGSFGGLSVPDVLFLCEDGNGQRSLVGLSQDKEDISYKDGITRWHGGFKTIRGKYGHIQQAVMDGMDVIYIEGREIRRWDRGTGEDRKIARISRERTILDTVAILQMGRPDSLSRYYLSIFGSSSQGTDDANAHRILVDDGIEQMVKMTGEDPIRAGDGFYSIAVKPEDDLLAVSVYELSDTETKEKVYDFCIKSQGIRSGCVHDKWVDDRSKYIYFFLGDVKGTNGYLLRFDVDRKKIEVACKKKLEGFSGPCCIKGERVFYGHHKGDDHRLMVLDLRSGMEECLWSGLPARIASMKMIDDHIVFLTEPLGDDERAKEAYMVKQDGTGKVIVDTGDVPDGPIQIYDKGEQISIVSIC